MTEYNIISTREQAFKAWDRTSVIIREEDNFYFIYPMLGRTYKYPTFNLKRECCLNTFLTLDKAQEWATSQGYSFSVIK